jgi:hypothetical protein
MWDHVRWNSIATINLESTPKFNLSSSLVILARPLSPQVTHGQWESRCKPTYISAVNITCRRKQYFYIIRTYEKDRNTILKKCIPAIKVPFLYFTLCLSDWLIDWFIVFKATFSNISAISWRSVLVVEEARVPGENHWPWASNW